MKNLIISLFLAVACTLSVNAQDRYLIDSHSKIQIFPQGNTMSISSSSTTVSIQFTAPNSVTESDLRQTMQAEFYASPGNNVFFEFSSLTLSSASSNGYRSGELTLYISSNSSASARELVIIGAPTWAGYFTLTQSGR